MTDYPYTKNEFYLPGGGRDSHIQAALHSGDVRHEKMERLRRMDWMCRADEKVCLHHLCSQGEGVKQDQEKGLIGSWERGKDEITLESDRWVTVLSINYYE